MYRPRRASFAAIAACGALLLAACGDDDDGGGEDTEAPAEEEGEGTEAPAEEEGEEEGEGEAAGAFAIDTSECPDGVSDPIEGTVSIGTTLPLSGGAAAAAFAPVAEGMEAYVQYANENELLPGFEIELAIEDDQFNSNLTTPAVESLLDNTGVHLFSGMIGTANNQAVRDLLNEECYPQLFANSGSPIFGDVENYPWTTGILAPYNTETAIYVADMQAQFPDGATAGLFHVNSEFGDAYAAAFEELGPEAGIEIVETQTIENADSNPPTSQVNAIAAQQPDVILAVPLGAQCPTFLSEVANAKAANPGWEPRVYITATCASTLLLSIAGANADGIITITNAKDPMDPANAEDPDVVEYRAAMEAAGFPADGDFATAGAGWTAMELTVEVLQRAAESPDGLTRESIINAARSQDYEFLLARDGVAFTMSGADDAYGSEILQVVQYDADTSTYTDLGEIQTQFEGQTELPE
jgi:ABC-type branched-subunit amino acid transport system substrate-binding protein